MKIGYERVSTGEQSLESQHQFLVSIGCDKIYSEKQSGKEAANRSELMQLLDFCREGDEIHVTKVDRLTRNTLDALKIADTLKAKNVALYCHDLGNIDINSDIGTVIYSTISAIAEMERKRILQRCQEGRDIAKKNGKHLGRYPNQAFRERFEQLYKIQPELAKSEMARQLNCSRPTIYKLIKEFNDSMPN